MRLNEVTDNRTKFRMTIKTIDKDCGQYIKMIGGWQKWYAINSGEQRYRYNLFRGMDEKESFIVKQVRENRVPKDTPKYIHKAVDNWFFKELGHRYRSNAAFATSNTATAGAYGAVYAIFPIGSTMLCYSPTIEDLWEDIDIAVRVDRNLWYEKDQVEILNVVMDILKGGDYKESMDVAEAIKLRHETMIDCDRYYAVHWDSLTKGFIDQVGEMLESGELK